VLVDLLIGAHASERADRLLTLDAGRYRQAFPDLKVEPLRGHHAGIENS